MKAMIFAAGLGTRLRPLTDTMPKALVPVGGHPLLEIQLRRLIAAGVTDVVINVHHFAGQIRNYVERNDGFGINIRFSDETDCLLDTGGGIKKAMPLLGDAEGGTEPFLVHNVDILSNVDLADFYRRNALRTATLLVSPRVTQRYLLFTDDLRLVGWTNVKTGQVRTPFHGLDVTVCRKYAFAGIHLFSPSLFPEFARWGNAFSIIDFYLSICHRVPIYGHCEEQLRLMDVGKLDTLALADEFYCMEYSGL